MNQLAPLKTFIIYSSKDRELREQLESHLRALVDLEWISLWSDKEIAPGERWDKAIKDRLLDTEIFLMLVSVDFYNSGYIREEEFKTAIRRLESGDSMVIPIIVRPCDWESYPIIKDLQVLPPGGHAVTDTDHWKDRDKAWHTIAKKLRERVQDLRAEREAVLAALVAEAQRAKEADLAAEAQRAKEAAAAIEDQLRQAQQQRLEKERLAALAAEAQRAKEAAQRAKDTETARLHAEQEHERHWQEAHNAAWTATTEQHTTAAYQQFLTAYPQSTNAREARQRIKTLKQADRQPVAWGRWAGVGVGLVALGCVIWMLIPSSDSKGVTPPITTEMSDSLRPKDPDPTPSQTDKGVQTISPENLPENTGVKKSEPIGAPKETTTTTSFTFNYPMVRVAGGSFTMGSPATEANRSNDECQHQVTVASFSIGKTEVTQAQWKSVMGSNPSSFKGDNLPVESVSWNDAQAFIKKLNEKTGKIYRLPFEKEWEYAARGGHKSKGYFYAGGNLLGEVAWHSSNSGDNTHPVATKKANELGLYDMSGNVWEWCQDIYKAYPCDKGNKGDGSFRCLRGGAWNDYGYHRCAERDNFETSSRSNNVGFRLAQD